MTDFADEIELKEKDLKEFNNICEQCKKEDKSVSQNLIITGFKYCDSCKTSRTLFPVQLILLTGKAFILLITKDNDRKAIIKKDKNTIPKDFKLDFILSTCLIEIISEANIHN